MKLMELYNPTISGTTYTGFIKALNSYRPLGETATWYENIDANELDNYIFYNLSQRDLFSLLSGETKLAFDYIYSILKANEYKLNGLYDSTTYGDKYSPIENYYRVEDSTTDTEADNGARKSTQENGARTSSTNYGSDTDTTVSYTKTSPFDSAEYDAPTNKDIVEAEKGGHIDTTNDAKSTDVNSIDASHDETSTVYHTTARGNIGVTRVDTMLQGQRNIVDYVFFDEIIKLICNTMLKSCLWNV